MELCARFLEMYPEAQGAMRSVISFLQEEIDSILEGCTQFDVSIPFTAERAKFVSRLIAARRAQLLVVLGG
jgi:hypothetical protein